MKKLKGEIDMTKQAKHTQGPWKIVAEDKKSWDSVAQKPCVSTWLDIYTENDDFVPNGVYSSQWPEDKKQLTIANARLIAAAPELLEAAKETEAILNGPTGYGMKNSPAYHAWNKLRAAIAKAEGK